MMTDYNSLFNTVKLYIKKEKSDGSATGFFYKFKKNGKEYITLITNKHVVKDAIDVSFFIHQSFDAPGNIRKFTLSGEIINKIVIYHSSCDLCMIDLSNYIEDTDKYCSLDNSDIIDENDLTYDVVMQNVFIVGYPVGIEDDLNKLPIFSTGTTATSLLIEYNGEPLILLNAFALPGSSGSPVFVNLKSQKYLIGVIVGGKISEGKPISDLSIAIKAKEILQLEKIM